MSLTVHIYCNGLEQGSIEIVYDETIESLSNKITDTFSVSDFVFEEGFDVSTICQDDSIYIEHDVVKNATLIVEDYMFRNDLYVISGEPDFIRAVIDAGMVNTLVDNNGMTILIHASCNGQCDAIMTLIDAGADINIKDNDGDTSLHWAAYMGRNNIVQLLIDTGVDVNIKNNDGHTALHDASCTGYYDIVQMLTDAGCRC